MTEAQASGAGGARESFGIMETEVRRPVAQRDPARPHNWHNLFRLRFPPHAPARVAPRADAESDVDAESDIDEQRRAARASIAAEAAGIEPRREDVAAAADEPAPPPARSIGDSIPSSRRSLMPRQAKKT